MLSPNHHHSSIAVDDNEHPMFHETFRYKLWIYVRQSVNVPARDQPLRRPNSYSALKHDNYLYNRTSELRRNVDMQGRLTHCHCRLQMRNMRLKNI
jgi:hypothetical protein